MVDTLQIGDEYELQVNASTRARMRLVEMAKSEVSRGTVLIFASEDGKRIELRDSPGIRLAIHRIA